MTKIYISLLLVASFGGIMATIAEHAHPGSLLYAFKIHVNDSMASALCGMDLPCAK